MEPLLTKASWASHSPGGEKLAVAGPATASFLRFQGWLRVTCGRHRRAGRESA